MIFYIIISLLILWIYFRYLGPVIITFTLDSPYSIRPTKAYGKAACWDVYASDDVDGGAIPVGQWREVPLGISLAPWPHIYIPWLKLTLTPFGNVATKIHIRSGMGIKNAVRNSSSGIIDNDYRKSLTIVLYNHGKYPLRITRGTKIGQLEFYRVPSTIMIRTSKLTRSQRGESGFGSSGR